MNWDAIGAIGEVIGAIAVLITLAYLAVQIRQNAISLDKQSDIARAQILQSRADSVTGLASVITADPENIRVFAKLQGMEHFEREAFTDEEFVRAQFVLTMLRANLENTYLQYKQGYLPEEFYRDVGMKNNISVGRLLLEVELPLTESFRGELLRNLSEAGIEYKKAKSSAGGA